MWRAKQPKLTHRIHFTKTKLEKGCIFPVNHLCLVDIDLKIFYYVVIHQVFLFSFREFSPVQGRSFLKLIKHNFTPTSKMAHSNGSLTRQIGPR